MTTPSELILRIVFASATYTLPSVSTATPRGLEKLAAEPMPSSDPDMPLPASVVTIPYGLILRTSYRSRCTTYTLPSVSVANLATAPGDDMKRPLASVVTTLSGLILRTRSESVTYTFPAVSTATLDRVPKLADEPVPSADPDPLVPASTDTTPAGLTLKTREPPSTIYPLKLASTATSLG